jgi:hypothetical protein
MHKEQNQQKTTVFTQVQAAIKHKTHGVYPGSGRYQA